MMRSRIRTHGQRLARQILDLLCAERDVRHDVAALRSLPRCVPLQIGGLRDVSTAIAFSRAEAYWCMTEPIKELGMADYGSSRLAPPLAAVDCLAGQRRARNCYLCRRRAPRPQGRPARVVFLHRHP